MNAIGIDIGGTGVKLAAVDGAGKTLWTAMSARYERPTAEQVARAIREAAAGRLSTSVAGDLRVGMCVPGILDDGRTTIRHSVNLPGLNGVRPDELVAAALTHPGTAVAVATDAIATAYDIYTARQLKGRLFLLAIGTGVGAAVMDEGRPLRVDGDSPGHFGQLDVSIAGHPVVGPDGGAGSLEGYLSGPALALGYGGDPTAWQARIAVDDPAMQALVRAVRIAHALYRPHHVYVAGGIGIRLGRLVPALRAAIAHQLSSIARSDWTLAVGDDDYHAARGAAKWALLKPSGV